MGTKTITKESLLIEIDNKTNAMLKLGKHLTAISPNIEPFDLLLISIVNRTVNLNSAFTSLSRANNFIAAAPLVRINLDSLLRIYASYLTNYDNNTFAKKVMGGLQINKMKYKNTKDYLHDSRIVKELKEVKGMDWVEKVYLAGNSFVHFSDSVFYSSQKIADEKEKTIMVSIGLHDSFINESEKFGATVWMNKIIDSIILQCQIWMYDKCQRYNYNFEDLNNVS